MRGKEGAGELNCTVGTSWVTHGVPLGCQCKEGIGIRSWRFVVVGLCRCGCGRGMDGFGIQQGQHIYIEELIEFNRGVRAEGTVQWHVMPFPFHL